jgi:hypothetical protein
MRWTDPKEGDTRVRSGFLFFPKTINGEERWLEWARWEERYEVWTEMWAVDSGWVPIAWLSDTGHD